MGDIVADIDRVLAAGEPEPAVVLCPGATVDAVMVRRPAPCDCDLCSGRFEAFMHSLGMRRIASIDPGDPTAAAIIVAALAATQGLIEDMLGPQFRVGFG